MFLLMIVLKRLEILLLRGRLWMWRKGQREGSSYTGKSDTSTGSRGFVHLSKDQGDLGVTIEVNDLCLLHFVVQIVTLTGTLTDT